MRHRSHILCVVILAFWAFFSSPVKADVDISVFIEALSPYGTWVNHPTYGQAWFPRGMPDGWRPYTDGRWVYTEEFGWTWESDLEWGWAPFHYGRWVWDDWYGWIWIPGRVWAPAWVFWRFGGGFVGWAPMPPDVVWRPGFGLHSPRFFVDRDLPWDFWICVRANHFPDRRIRRHILAPRDNINIIRITQNVTNITVINNRIVNRSIPLRPIEHAFGRRITAERVREVDELAGPRRERHPGELTVIRPRQLEAIPPGDEREQEELINRIAQDREARRQAQPEPEQFRPRVPRRLLESSPEDGGRPGGERPREIREGDQGLRQELPQQQEQQRQREEQLQRQQEMERRGMEQPRQIREQDQRQQQELQRQQEQRRQREEQMQRQQEMDRRAVERQRQEEQTRQIREREQRQQETQRQREEQMQRQQETERRAVEQQRQEEQTRQIREREQRQQQELQRQQESQRQRLEMQRRQESERRVIEQRGPVEPPRQIQERPQQRPQQDIQRPPRQQQQRQEQIQRQRQRQIESGSGRSGHGREGQETQP